MTRSLNKPKPDKLAGDMWKSAERLRETFKAYEYQHVILPIIVIRRRERVLIDCGNLNLRADSQDNLTLG